MKRYFVALTLVLTPGLSVAQTVTAENAWIREAPSFARVQSAYMTLHNSTTTDVVIIGANSPEYDAIALHDSVLENGVMRMVPLDNMVVPAQGELSLKPGSFHLMFTGPKAHYKEGQIIHLTVQLSEGNSASIEVSVIGSGEFEPPPERSYSERRHHDLSTN